MRGTSTPTETQALCERLRTSTELMANLASAPMDLWNRHSNACLEAAALLTRQQEALDWEKAHSAEAAKEVECLLLEIERLRVAIDQMTKERTACQIQAGERADDVHHISERYYNLLYAANNLRKGVTGHYVNAEDLYCFDTTLAALQARP